MKILVKIGTIFGVVVLVCTWTLALQAEGRRGEKQQGLREVLGLSEAQFASIIQEQQAREERLGEIHTRIQQFDEQIYQAAEETADPLTVGKLVLEKIALQKQIRAEDEAYEQRVNSILTPEQQAKLAQVREAANLLGERIGFGLFDLGTRERREAPRRREVMRRPPEGVPTEK